MPLPPAHSTPLGRVRLLPSRDSLAWKKGRAVGFSVSLPSGPVKGQQDYVNAAVTSIRAQASGQRGFRGTAEAHGGAGVRTRLMGTSHWGTSHWVHNGSGTWESLCQEGLCSSPYYGRGSPFFKPGQLPPAHKLGIRDKPKLDTMDIAIQHPWFRRALGSLYPTRLFDQFFGEGVFEYDFFPYVAPTISPYYRQTLFRNFLDSSNTGISEVRSDRDKFSVHLDVKHFSPDELNVKVDDDYVDIQGKHGERQDDHGYISREFHRRYRLPPSVDQSAITCTLSHDGLLTLYGPKVSTGTDSNRSDRSIPVTRDDKPNSAPPSS
ncbi:hypothetical protein AAFF_G00019850 [Aldrovandia affinis]|uniref:Alpha-crystallin A chain n=1 Tax=Aldrovandia affinis TaxID=143900 RepID=A0AAD7S5Y6_9TELE|nr:hypothetical protein AAFF_G00019850 [Aldrovandia affinis]